MEYPQGLFERKKMRRLSKTSLFFHRKEIPEMGLVTAADANNFARLTCSTDLKGFPFPVAAAERSDIKFGMFSFRRIGKSPLVSVVKYGAEK